MDGRIPERLQTPTPMHPKTMHVPGAVGVEGMFLLLKSGFISKQQLRELNMAKLQASLETGLNGAY